MEIKKAKKLSGSLAIPGDKSISHRAVMFGSLAEGTTRITNFLEGADCLSTISCFRKMGINIENTEGEILVHGKGLHGLSAPSETLDVGNSGTTTRLISGILAGQDFVSELTGDASIQKRPMKRIMTPLSQMGADIVSLNGNGCAPLKIEGTTASIEPEPVLNGREIKVPGDISSAAYFIAAGLLTPGSEILLKNVGINPTRDGMLRVCKAMGADITLLNASTEGEPTADLLIRTSSLHGTTVEGEIIPTLIDEIPMIAVMAAFAEGTTVIRDAQELKVKESDRIAVEYRMKIQPVEILRILLIEPQQGAGLVAKDAAIGGQHTAPLIRGGRQRRKCQVEKAEVQIQPAAHHSQHLTAHPHLPLLVGLRPLRFKRLAGVEKCFFGHRFTSLPLRERVQKSKS